MNTELHILFLLELKFTKCYYLKVITEIAYTFPFIINSYALDYDICVYYFHFHHQTLLTISLQSIKPRVSHCLSLRLFLRCNTL